jgi:hypothetical protein
MALGWTTTAALAALALSGGYAVTFDRDSLSICGHESNRQPVDLFLCATKRIAKLAWRCFSTPLQALYASQ